FRSLPVRLDVVLERVVEPALLGARQLLQPDLEVLVLVAVLRGAAALDDGVLLVPDQLRLVAYLLERRELLRLERDLDAALEVDAQIEATGHERDDADQNDGARDREPQVAAAHEVDLQQPHVVDAPMKRGLLNQRKPASRPSIARVAATAVISEIAVPISSMSAKPFTPAVARRKRTSAVIAVTTFASMIVWKPLAYPAEIAARTDLPARTSSLLRSKMTTFTSAGTP